MSTTGGSRKRNPFAQRWEDMAAYERGMERKAMVREARISQSEEVYTCEKCGGDAFHRPGVGGWWCEDCGELVIG